MTRIILAASITLSFTAFAQDGGMMPAPQPSKEMADFMKPVEGSWKCDTRMMAGTMGPGSPESVTKTTLKIAKDKDLKGMWYRGDYSAPKSKTMPEMKGSFMLTLDDASKQVTAIGWDSFGTGSMGTGTISGETMTWSGDSMMMGQKAKMRDTVTKTGPKGMTHKVEMDAGKGWVVMAEDTCTK